QLGPFGSGNAEPRFAIADARLVEASVVGDGHVRCVLVGADDRRLKAIAFRSLEGALGPALLKAGGAAWHLAGHLRLDTCQASDRGQLLFYGAAPGGEGSPALRPRP